MGLSSHSQQEVLCVNQGLAAPFRLLVGESEDPPRSWAHSSIIRCPRVGSDPNDPFDIRPGWIEGDTEGSQGFGDRPGGLPDNTQKDVLGAEVFVAQTRGLLVGQAHDST